MLDAVVLGDFPGPILVIAAAEDSIATAGALEALVATLPRAECAVIPRADHFFGAGLADIGRIAAEWFGRG
jgi:pimeloyl-ACP methyl ester carboxylesterase